MPKRKKSKKTSTEKTLKKFNLLRFQKDLEELKEKASQEGYKPKIGRQMKQLEKKIKQVS